MTVRRAAMSLILRVGAVLFVLSIPVALVGTNVRVLFGQQRLYTFAINRYQVDQVTGIPKPELFRATRELRDYLLGPDDLLHIDVMSAAGASEPLFSEREVLHMRDVRRLVQRIFRAREVALLIGGAYAAVRIARERRHGAYAVARLLWLTATAFNFAVVAFAVSAALGFDRIFTEFHVLSFSNDFWLLDPTRDRLVQMFPFEFWQIATGLLVALTLAESALIALVARVIVSRLAPAGQDDAGPDADAPPNLSVGRAPRGEPGQTGPRA